MAPQDQDRRGQASAQARGSELDDGLVGHLGELAREFARRHGSASTLDAVVGAAVDDIPGAEHASVTVVRRRRDLQTLASTSDLARDIDKVQYDVGQGPCLETLYEHVTIRSDDMSEESRWPRFARHCVEMGVGSMLAFQLYTDGDDLGALNLFAPEADGFSDESEQIGLAFSAHAAVAVAAAQQIESLKRAVDSRDVIGQAKGILMERHAIDADVAFSVLVRHSRDENVKLVDVAQQVVSTRRGAEREGRPPAPG